MGERERKRCRSRLEALSAATLDPEQARRAAIEELRRAVGFDRWCWPLTDPASGLSMSGIGEFDFFPSLPRMVALEEQGDITSKPHLVVGAQPSITLSGATRGDLTRSRRWRECLRPYGIGDELMTACRDRHGCWGSVELMRDAGDRPFGEDDARLLHDLAPVLGAMLRRALAHSWRASSARCEAKIPGTLILDRELRTEGRTASVGEWLADLPTVAELLPTALYEIAARALTPPDAFHGLPTRVRVRAQSGNWSVIEGAKLEGGEPGRVAITIRAGSGDEVFDLMCKAHDLTPRERELVGLMRRGFATRQLAEALRISAYTIQDHLKAIFAKTGIRSRRELMPHLAGHAPGSDAHAGDPAGAPARSSSRPAPAAMPRGAVARRM